MADEFDDGYKKSGEKSGENPPTPRNSRKIPKRQTAVALRDSEPGKEIPVITAAGRGKIAEKILQLAFDNDIKVREDGPLAEMLARFEIDSPVPAEAWLAVAEILSYVYRANGMPNPFDAALKNAKRGDEQETGHG